MNECWKGILKQIEMVLDSRLDKFTVADMLCRCVSLVIDKLAGF
jgi:hypothetical protein